MSFKSPFESPSAALCPSPCVGLCRLNDDDICRGCFRHIDEIAGWGLLDAEAQRKILARLPERRLSLSVTDTSHD
jgi:uncharacterized protein